MIKVFKFGGASVKDAEAVKNITNILKLYPNTKLAIVISAMGKITNAFETLLKSYFDNKNNINGELSAIKDFHFKIIDKLFDNKQHPIFAEVNAIFSELEEKLQSKASENYDYEYDQIVSNGEILSTLIISSYLNKTGFVNKWIDARKTIKTNNSYRDARICWQETEKCLTDNFDFQKQSIYITQGFIGGTRENLPTTLGREGSDFSAAIIAYCLSAKDVTIWKDVPGVLNADPKWFDETIKIDKLSYYDALELAYYGASVIHPKTIKPLQNKEIPLYVKSFLNPTNEGTIVTKNINVLPVPSFIFKIDQVLITISTKDFSFVAEKNLRDIFHIFSKMNVAINLMQNSALSFSVCVNNDDRKIPKVIEQLKEKFNVKYNCNLELVTIRYYDQQTIDRVSSNKDIILEEKSRHNMQMVMRDLA